MNTDQTHNGWTNYATWRVNLEILSDLELVEYFPTKPDISDVVEFIKDYVDDALTCIDCAGITLDYARAFVSEVNWHEIAQNGIDQYYSDDDTDNNQN